MLLTDHRLLLSRLIEWAFARCLRDFRRLVVPRLPPLLARQEVRWCRRRPIAVAGVPEGLPLFGPEYGAAPLHRPQQPPQPGVLRAEAGEFVGIVHRPLRH